MWFDQFAGHSVSALSPKSSEKKKERIALLKIYDSSLIYALIFPRQKNAVFTCSLLWIQEKAWHTRGT